MPEHHIINIESTTAFCPKCQTNKQHRVDGGRPGPRIDVDQDNPFRTIPGLHQFRVIWLDLKDRKQKIKDFVRYDEALALFTTKGGDIATLWKTSTTPHQHIR